MNATESKDTTPATATPAATPAGKVPLIKRDDIRPDGIPAELRNRPQWLAWSYEPGDGGKFAKVPKHATRPGRNGSSTGPSTWGTLEQAMATARRMNYTGVGFVFTADDGIVGVDIDHCRNPDTGAILPQALKLVAHFGSYAEVSPSGTGVKIWARSGSMPAAYTHKKEFMDGESPYEVEVYHTGRWFAVTGHRLEGTPAEVRERTQGGTTAVMAYLESAGLVGKRKPGKPQAPRELPQAPEAVQMEEDRLRAALACIGADDETTWFRMGCALKAWGANPSVGDDRARALWDSWSAKSSKYDEGGQDGRWSRVSPDGGVGVGTIFAEAADEGHEYGCAQKADGTEYQAGGTAPGMEWVEDIEQWDADCRQELAYLLSLIKPMADAPKPAASPKGVDGKPFRRLTLKRGKDIRELDDSKMWLVPGIIPRHGITFFYSAPGGGKSLMALDLAVALTHDGKPWLSNRPVTEQGAVLYLTLDQDEGLTKRRELLLGGSGNGNVYYVDSRDLDPIDKGGSDQLRDVFAQADKAGTPIVSMFVDVWADVTASTPSRKDAYLGTSDEIRAFKKVTDGRDVAIVVLSHLNKLGQPTGATSQWGKAEAAYKMQSAPVSDRKRHGEYVLDRRVIVETIKNRLGNSFKNWAVDMWFEDGDSAPGVKPESRKVLVWREDVKVVNDESNKVKILEAMEGLLDAESALSPTAIADLVKDSGIAMSHGAVQKCLQRLNRDGLIAKSGRGVYWLADAWAVRTTTSAPPDWKQYEPIYTPPCPPCPQLHKSLTDKVFNVDKQVDNKWTSGQEACPRPAQGAASEVANPHVDKVGGKTGLSTSCPLVCPRSTPCGCNGLQPCGHVDRVRIEDACPRDAKQAPDDGFLDDGHPSSLSLSLVTALPEPGVAVTLDSTDAGQAKPKDDWRDCPPWPEDDGAIPGGIVEICLAAGARGTP